MIKQIPKQGDFHHPSLNLFLIDISVFQVDRLAADKAKVQLSHSGFTDF
jgi:hypothetical protein